MVMVRETVTGDWRALRDIRLEALRDAPAAFGSTYEREVLRPEAHWRDRIARGGTFLAFVPEVSAAAPAGLIGGYQEDPVTVELVSMYVRPRARGRGVGEALVATVINWASREERRVGAPVGDRGERPCPRTVRALRVRADRRAAAAAVRPVPRRGGHVADSALTPPAHRVPAYG